MEVGGCSSLNSILEVAMAHEDLWKCRVCGKLWVVPSLAKDCCTRLVPPDFGDALAPVDTVTSRSKKPREALAPAGD